MLQKVKVQSQVLKGSSKQSFAETILLHLILISISRLSIRPKQVSAF